MPVSIKIERDTEHRLLRFVGRCAIVVDDSLLRFSFPSFKFFLLSPGRRYTPEDPRRDGLKRNFTSDAFVLHRLLICFSSLRERLPAFVEGGFYCELIVLAKVVVRVRRARGESWT